MGIVSVSLNEENLAALDKIQSVYGLSGRSEAVRASINAALADIRELESLDGEVEGVLIIVRGNHEDPWMIRIQGMYERVIRTQLHSHLRNHKCLEVMVVSSDADTLSSMIREIQSEGKADYVKFVRGRRGPSIHRGSAAPRSDRPSGPRPHRGRGPRWMPPCTPVDLNYNQPALLVDICSKDASIGSCRRFPGGTNR